MRTAQLHMHNGISNANHQHFILVILMDTFKTTLMRYKWHLLWALWVERQGDMTEFVNIKGCRFG